MSRYQGKKGARRPASSASAGPLMLLSSAAGGYRYRYGDGVAARLARPMRQVSVRRNPQPRLQQVKILVAGKSPPRRRVSPVCAREDGGPNLRRAAAGGGRRRSRRRLFCWQMSALKCTGSAAHSLRLFRTETQAQKLRGCAALVSESQSAAAAVSGTAPLLARE